MSCNMCEQLYIHVPGFDDIVWIYILGYNNK